MAVSLTHLRFQCSICGTYKSADNFSKNELKGAQWQKSQNPAMNGRSARIRCSKCTGQQRHELECLKCGDVLEISKFSKTSKKAGGNQVRISYVPIACLSATQYYPCPYIHRRGRLTHSSFSGASNVLCTRNLPSLISSRPRLHPEL